MRISGSNDIPHLLRRTTDMSATNSIFTPETSHSACREAIAHTVCAYLDSLGNKLLLYKYVIKQIKII